MRRVKQRVFSGAVLEQVVYTIPDRARDARTAKAKLRFENEEQRLKHKEGISRRRHAQLFNANFSPTSLYSTLTFDNEHEVHTFDDAKRIRDNYIRRLQYAFPDAVIFFYLGRGKATRRIHAHMVSEGIPAEAIADKWGMGEIIRIEHLKEHNYYEVAGRGLVDCGRDYSGLANYLFNHWTPEPGGHRWKATKNRKEPEKEAPRECLRRYSKKVAPAAPPGYELVETMVTTYGFLYYKYVRKAGP